MIAAGCERADYDRSRARRPERGFDEGAASPMGVGLQCCTSRRVRCGNRPATLVGAASAATRAAPDAAEAAPTAQAPGAAATLPVSALTGAGLDTLRHELARRAGAGSDGTFSARARHVAALEQAATRLAAGIEALEEQRAGELLAEELRLAHQALGEITGQTTADDLLGRIFGEFCIGK